MWFTSRKTLEILREKELLKHMESPWISIFINLVWIKHRFQEICIGSPWYFVDIFCDNLFLVLPNYIPFSKKKKKKKQDTMSF